MTSNYSIWKLIMEDIIYSKDLHDPIKGDSTKSKDKSKEEWKMKNRKVIGYIIQ